METKIRAFGARMAYRFENWHAAGQRCSRE
jgi:hypothetical protein